MRFQITLDRRLLENRERLNAVLGELRQAGLDTASSQPLLDRFGIVRGKGDESLLETLSSLDGVEAVEKDEQRRAF